MAQLALLDKMARNCEMLGLTIASRTTTSVTVDNGSNDLVLSLVDATFSPAVVGGVDPSVSPFLGIGVSAPCSIRIKSNSTATDTIADVLDSVVAARVLRMAASFANDIILENSDATFRTVLRGHPDVLGLGQ